MGTIAAETIHLEQQLGRARSLLREWRDKYGGREHYRTGHFGASGHPTDLLRDTIKFLEGK